MHVLQEGRVPKPLHFSDVRQATSEDVGSSVLILRAPMGTHWGGAASGILDKVFSTAGRGGATVRVRNLKMSYDIFADDFVDEEVVSNYNVGVRLRIDDIFVPQMREKGLALGENVLASPPGSEVYDLADAKAAEAEGECFDCRCCRAKFVQSELQPAFARAACAVLGLNPLALPVEKILALSMLAHHRLGALSGMIY